jgi:hypothetical protein
MNKMKKKAAAHRFLPPPLTLSAFAFVLLIAREILHVSAHPPKENDDKGRNQFF